MPKLWPQELDAIGLRVGGSPFYRGTIACSGTEFCKLAITETKSFSRWLVEELEERLPGFDQHLKLHVTGCPNSCGQHWIADIGIDGKKIKVDGRLVDAYYFCLGGALGLHQSTARPHRLSLPGDGSSRRHRAIAHALPGALDSQMKIFVSFLRGTMTPNCASFWPAQPVGAVSRDLPASSAWGWRTRQEATVTDLFPMFMKLTGKQCLVVGAGKVGEPKIGGLIDTGAQHPRGRIRGDRTSPRMGASREDRTRAAVLFQRMISTESF